MVNEKNIQLIENKKAQIEEVRELKETEQEQKIRESYEAEFESYDDIEVEKSYGPGSVQSNYSRDSDRDKRERHLGKAGVGLASNITSKVVTPIVPAAVGAATSVVSELGYALSSDSDTKDAWKYASELGQDMVKGFVVGDFVDSLRLPYVFKSGWDLWQDFQEKGGRDKLMINYHDFHLANGENYSSYCDVCKS